MFGVGVVLGGFDEKLSELERERADACRRLDEIEREAGHDCQEATERRKARAKRVIDGLDIVIASYEAWNAEGS